MTTEVFLSYARQNRAPAEALHAALREVGVSVFLDTAEIPYGASFPDRLIDAMLDARVVVVFGDPVYFTRWYCQLELRAACEPARLAMQYGASDEDRVASVDHIVLALGVESASPADFDGLPPAVLARNWPKADETGALVRLIQSQLIRHQPRLRDRLRQYLDESATRALFLRRALLPQPRPLTPMPVATPLAVRSSIHDRFVGREDDLWRLHQLLAPGRGTTGGRAGLTSALKGGGGVGKTQIAAEYFHRYGPRHYTGGLFWIDAEQEVEPQHHRILVKLDPQTPDLKTARGLQPPIQERLMAALREQVAKGPMLLVIDNVPEADGSRGQTPDPLERWCPVSDAVACLATSRSALRYGSGGTLESLDIRVPDEDTAIAMLTAGKVDRRALSEDEWKRIAGWVGRLPLALTLLNSAMDADFQPYTPRRYLEDADRGLSTTTALDRTMNDLRGVVPQHALRGITEALLVSYQRLSPDAQVAARMLAVLGPEPIPLALMDALGAETRNGAVRAMLTARSFVTPVTTSASERELPIFGSLHRVLADFIRANSPDPTRDASVAVDALRSLFATSDTVSPGSWPLLNALAPHCVVTLGRHFDEGTPQVVECISLRTALALLARAQGDYASAKRYGEANLGLAKKLLGQDHRATLTSMLELAHALWAQGDFAGARSLEEHVLAVRKRLLGPEHPATLTSMNNLAGTLRDQGDFAGARALQEQVLAARTRLLGQEHPDTLTSMNNLAGTLRDQGDLAGARALHEQVLAARTRLLGQEHPDTLTSMNNLASALWAQRDFAGARSLEEHVLAARKRLLGPEHPATLTSMNNLAGTLMDQGDFTGARALHEQALAALSRLLGPEHPTTLTSMSNLASTLGAQSDFAGGRALYERVVASRTRLLGPEHPDTLISTLNLAIALFRQGEVDGARSMLGTAYDVSLRVLGATHETTVALRQSLDLLS
jgi:tetratricopeptide (TPR) repeat protein